MDLKQLDRNILGEVWTAPDLWENLAYLCDACNGRFAGSEDERRAGNYLLSRFQDYGLDLVRAEEFQMRGWVRGPAEFTLLEQDRSIPLACMALPGSEGCDLEAEVIDVGQGKAADYVRLGESVRGKIVFPSLEGASRSEKYQAAIEAGAAAFIMSGGQPGMIIPTGSIEKDLPAVGLTSEGAARLKRLLTVGPVHARLRMESHSLPMTARNIIAELPGTDPEQGWILACAHYDGHDFSQAAQDNAAGSVVVLEAARLLAPLRQHLKAGIRFALFSGEELGLWGSYAYAEQHADQMDQTRLVFNVDVVAMAMPLVLQTQASPDLAAYLRGLPLRELDISVSDGPGSFIMNSDHFPFSMAGLPGVWAVTSAGQPGTGWVHTAADTLDKIELRTLRQTAAAAARVLLRMAVEPSALPRGRKSPGEVENLVREAGFERALRFTGRWPFEAGAA